MSKGISLGPPFTRPSKVVLTPAAGAWRRHRTASWGSLGSDLISPFQAPDPFVYVTGVGACFGPQPALRGATELQTPLVAKCCSVKRAVEWRSHLWLLPAAGNRKQTQVPAP